MPIRFVSSPGRPAAEHRAEVEPRSFVVDGTRRRVLGIADRWLGPEASYFKVRADDGHGYLLRYDRLQNTWSLVQVIASHA